MKKYNVWYIPYEPIHIVIEADSLRDAIADAPGDVVEAELDLNWQEDEA